MQHPQPLHGPPHLTLAGLSLWVLSWESVAPNTHDEDWLNILAHVEAPGARVQTQGPVIQVAELARFLTELEVLSERLQGSAHLDCIEPELNVKLTCDRLGGIEIVVQITPDHMTQAHTIEFAADQTY